MSLGNNKEKLTKYFSRKEFSCNCNCGQNTIDYKLIVILTIVRKYFGSPITINSGNRCFNHNHQIGGSPKSQHVKSKAADIVVKGIDPQTVYDFLDITYPDDLGLGNYKSFTHIDVRSNKARW